MSSTLSPAPSVTVVRVGKASGVAGRSTPTKHEICARSVASEVTRAWISTSDAERGRTERTWVLTAVVEVWCSAWRMMLVSSRPMIKATASSAPAKAIRWNFVSEEATPPRYLCTRAT